MRCACLTVMLLFIIPSAAVAADQEFDTAAIVGVWKTEPNEDGAYSHIEVFEEAGRYNGRIIWLSSPLYGDDEPEGPPGQPRIDKENPDDSLRERPLLGMDLMRGFQHNGKNKWEDGRIYDPESGKEYRGKVTMLDPDTLELFGYVKVGFVKLGRDTIWNRVTIPDTESE